MTSAKVVAALLVLAVSMNPSLGDGGRIVTTGNSITNGYGGHRMQAEVAATGSEAAVVRVASSGATTARYLGLEEDPSTASFQDYTQLVLDQDPNVVVLILGTNDALRIAAGALDPNDFRANYDEILTRFLQSQNSTGRRPLLVVGTMIPVVAPQYAAAGAVIEQELNPWIRQVTLQRGIPLLDLNQQIQMLPDWQDLYSDGIHLWADGAAGYWWMAQRCAAAVAHLPQIGCGCVGDYDCSGSVDLADLATVLQHYGRGALGDLNFDGQTDLGDLALVLARYGRSCP